MFPNTARHNSLFVYHLHMGGPDADALEWQALLSPRFAPRLAQMGVAHVASASDADVVVVTGLLTERNLDPVLAELASMPSPSVVVALGDCAMNGSAWAKMSTSGLAPYPLSHYADVHVSVPGDPPGPQAIVAALSAAAQILAHPGERLSRWSDEDS
jgi:Ni,Fe-hydrogenase III small subunit